MFDQVSVRHTELITHAGHVEAIAGHAQTWRNVAEKVRVESDEFARAVRFDLTEWQGAAADAYRNLGWPARPVAASAGQGIGHDGVDHRRRRAVDRHGADDGAG